MIVILGHTYAFIVIVEICTFVIRLNDKLY